MKRINKVKTYSLNKRKSKVKLGNFCSPPLAGRSFSSFFDSLPKVLKASQIHAVVEAITNARKMRRSVIFMAGAHVIKCGLNPVVIELIKKKIITCLCLNGAGLIHDFEIASAGATSEDVAANLANGKFGMAQEPADFINQAARQGALKGEGLGYSIAHKIGSSKLRYKKLSVLYQAFEHKIPVCVFIAIGTDIIHQHPSFDAALSAEASLRDFHSLVENIHRLNRGGVLLNFGSSVILPEVFLKALNLARNYGSQVKDFTTANFDMIYHYRPAENVVKRPTLSGGKGYYIIGHHEINLPLLAQAVIEKV